MLAVISNYIPQIPDVEVDGVFGTGTQEAVLAAQQYFGLPQTGVVNAVTWEEIYDQFAGIENTSLRNEEVFPPSNIAGNSRRLCYARSATMTQFPGRNLSMGNQDPVRQEVIR